MSHGTYIALALGWLTACSAGLARPVIIDFDDLPGGPPGPDEGSPVPLASLVNDEYLSLGVLFSSAGGGIGLRQGSNPVSAPNVAVATLPGPFYTNTVPVNASFWVSGSPGVVDSVSVTLTDSSHLSKIEAFALNGSLLGSATGAASAVLLVSFPGQIHSVRILQGPMAFDDFTFDGLVPGPAPLVTILIGLCASRRRRGDAREC